MKGIKVTENGWIFLTTFFAVVSFVLLVASIADSNIFIFAFECLTVPSTVFCIQKF